MLIQIIINKLVEMILTLLVLVSLLQFILLVNTHQCSIKTQYVLQNSCTLGYDECKDHLVFIYCRQKQCPEALELINGCESQYPFYYSQEKCLSRCCNSSRINGTEFNMENIDKCSSSFSETVQGKILRFLIKLFIGVGIMLLLIGGAIFTGALFLCLKDNWQRYRQNRERCWQLCQKYLKSCQRCFSWLFRQRRKPQFNLNQQVHKDIGNDNLHIANVWYQNSIQQENLKVQDQSIKCSICLELNIDCITQCSHVFHAQCLQKKYVKQKVCPDCLNHKLKPVKLYCRFCLLNYVKYDIETAYDEFIRTVNGPECSDCRQRQLSISD